MKKNINETNHLLVRNLLKHKIQNISTIGTNIIIVKPLIITNTNPILNAFIISETKVIQTVSIISMNAVC